MLTILVYVHVKAECVDKVLGTPYLIMWFSRVLVLVVVSSVLFSV
jgi:hypothetical protein